MKIWHLCHNFFWSRSKYVGGRNFIFIFFVKWFLWTRRIQICQAPRKNWTKGQVFVAQYPNLKATIISSMEKICFKGPLDRLKLASTNRWKHFEKNWKLICSVSELFENFFPPTSRHSKKNRSFLIFQFQRIKVYEVLLLNYTLSSPENVTLTKIEGKNEVGGRWLSCWKYCEFCFSVGCIFIHSYRK